MADQDIIKPTLRSLSFPSVVQIGAGGAPVTFSAEAADDSSGVRWVRVDFDKFYADPASGGSASGIAISGSGPINTWAGSGTKTFGTASPTGTYNITGVVVTDQAGNEQSYSPAALRSLGIKTDFTVSSTAATDKTPPVLTSLTLPDFINVSDGNARLVTSVGATDEGGAGVANVSVILDRPYSSFGSPTANIFIMENGSVSFSSGVTSTTNTVSADTAVGKYGISRVEVTDYAGNTSTYYKDQLTAIGASTGFTVVNNSAPVTAWITGPSAVREGDDPFSLTMTLAGGQAGTVNVSVLADALHGSTSDLIGPYYDTTYAYASTLLLDLPPVTIVDDTIAEPNKLVSVYVRAPGRVFENGTDETVFTVTLIDNDLVGTGAADILRGDKGKNLLSGLGGDDVLIGGPGEDELTGGSGNDVFAGRLADMARDRITDLSVGDRIRIEDLDISTVMNARFGGELLVGSPGVFDGKPTIIGSSLLVGSPNMRITTVQAPDGQGVDLVAANRYSGLSDFNGDGHSDMLFQNVSGAVSTWTIQGNVRGNQVTQNSFFAGVAASWNVVETFDMNGDGRSDILWRNVDGTVAVWHAITGARTPFNQGSYLASSPGASWKIAATGDVDGDAQDDILWRHDDGSISVWQSAGESFRQNSYFHGSVGTNWQVAGLADFNGDGRDDILWRETGGAISSWLSNGSGFTENSYFDGSVAAASGWRLSNLADFNGDGRDDILWRNDNGAISVWQADASGGFRQNSYFAEVDPSWRVVQAGDFNADGAADLLWRNDNGALSIWQSNGESFDQNIYFDTGPAAGWTVQGHDILL